MQPGYDISNGYGLAGPRGMAKSIVSKPHAELLRALSAPESKQNLECYEIIRKAKR